MQTQHASQMMGNMNPSYMMDSMKSNIMTMMMFQQMGSGGGKSTNTRQDLFGMIYMFLATNAIDYLFKYLPVFLMFIQKYYMDKFASVQKELANSTMDLTDNKVKKKTASITITVNVNNPDNMLGQAILDYITNNKNTTHVSYIRENFILNQKDVIHLCDDVFAKMTESTADGGTLSNMSSQSGGGSSSSGGGFTSSGPVIVQIIEIYSFTKTMDELRDFLDGIKHSYAISIKNKLGNKRYFFNMHNLEAPMDINKTKDYSRLPPFMTFTTKQFQTNRKFSNLFGEEIDIIRKRVNFFCTNRKWYDEKGIPYTLGLLLSGNPGTGKTSTIKCLANETNRHIFNVNLNNDISKRQLENLFFNEDVTVLNPNTGQMETYCIPLSNRIFILEDVDAQSDIFKERSLAINDFKSSENKNDSNESNQEPDKHKIDLSFLLNLLDGVLENPGRIVIMTSNYPEILDGALIRPGRIDIIAKFRNCTIETMVKMIEFFYDIKLTAADLDRIGHVKSEILTPAELSKIMFENFRDYQKTIQYLVEMSQESEESEDSDSELTDSEDEQKRVFRIGGILRKTSGSESVAKLEYSKDCGTSSLTNHSDIIEEEDDIEMEALAQEKQPQRESEQHIKEDFEIVTGEKKEIPEPVNSFLIKYKEYKTIIQTDYINLYSESWKTNKYIQHRFLSKLGTEVFDTPLFKNYTKLRLEFETKYPEFLIHDASKKWRSFINYGKNWNYKDNFTTEASLLPQNTPMLQTHSRSSSALRNIGMELKNTTAQIQTKIELILNELNIRFITQSSIGYTPANSTNGGVHDYAIYG